MNLINNLQGGHCFGSSRTSRSIGGKITTFKLGYPVLTVAYDGACSPNISVSISLQEKKFDDSSRLDVVEITRVA